MIRFDRAAEEKFLNKPAILEVASVVVDAAKVAHSDRHYSRHNINLSIKWLLTEEFRASAYVINRKSHEIRLSYGSAIEIYRDAFVLPETCRNILTDEMFDRVFNLFSYGNQRQDVLPAGLTPLDAKVTIVRQMTTWLYLHEQAHLLQNHGDLAKTLAVPELLSNEGEILDAVAEKDQILNAKNAAIRHTLELAADYEAISYLVMGEAAEEGMTEEKLWCLAAGLMCMFQRFYSTAPAQVDATPSGTHPHPSVRMRMTMNKIIAMLTFPDFAKDAQWTKGPNHARAVMDHAVYTANIFWYLRYFDVKQKELLSAVLSQRTTPESYQKIIFCTWKSIETEILTKHLGDGEPVVMLLKGPESVG